MLDDPWYGFGNTNNYFRWNQLRPVGNTNVTEYNMKLAWQLEMASAFNLTYNQLRTVTNNWNALFVNQSDTFFLNELTTVVNSTYANEFGAAYWQWANGWISENYFAQPSLAEVYPGWYAGYFEISYFHTNYFKQVAAPGNVQAFSGVQMFASE